MRSSMNFHRRRYVFTSGIASVVFALCLASAYGQNAGSESASDAPAETPAETDDADVFFAPREDDEANVETLSPEEQAVALERRAGEQIGDVPAGHSIILGMHVQEGDSGRPRIVEVAAASPAFDAGIRKGDEIVSFDGFRGDNYREWIDGIRKLVTDTPDRETVSLVVLREGERLTADIQTAEANALDSRLPGILGQQLSDQRANQSNLRATGAGQSIQPGSPGFISDDDVFINGTGLFADEAAVGDRAVAQIFRITSQQQAPASGNVLPSSANSNAAGNARQTAPRGAGTAGQTTTPRSRAAVGTAGRIGLAGFQDSQNGMVVMLDVGNLPPGSYRVAIADPSIVMGAGQSPLRSALNEPQGGARRDVQRNEFDQRTGQDPIRDPRLDRQPPANRRIVPHGPANQRTPAPNLQRQSAPATQGGGDQRQGRIGPASQLIPPNVLAQVIDDEQATPATGQVNEPATPATGQVLPPATPPTGRVLPPGAPPTGRVLPSGTTPTGLPDPEGAAVTATDQQNAGANAGLATQGLSQFGMLTIDQSGTGRMQHVVEGVRVRDVAGQAIVLYAAANQPGTTVPPNANTSGTAVRGQTNANPGAAIGNAQEPQNAGSPQQLAARNQAQRGAAASTLGATGTPVAAGIIQMMPPGGTGQNAVDTTGAVGNTPSGSTDPREVATPATEVQQRELQRQTPPATRQRSATPQSGQSINR